MYAVSVVAESLVLVVAIVVVIAFVVFAVFLGATIVDIRDSVRDAVAHRLRLYGVVALC